MQEVCTLIGALAHELAQGLFRPGHRLIVLVLGPRFDL
jgi:hypothetical protein